MNTVKHNKQERKNKEKAKSSEQVFMALRNNVQ